MFRRRKQQALVDSLCEALVLLRDYAAAGPIFDPPDVDNDVRPVVSAAQRALEAVGAPSSERMIMAHVRRLHDHRAEALAVR
jgi:hypothetical protein